MAEARFADNDDARRELADMLKRHVQSLLGHSSYDVDIEHFDRAVLAFADEWAQRDLARTPDA